MKKILIMAIALTAILFSGCSRMTPSVAASIAQMYDTTKTIVVKGQEVVITNSDLLDTETLNSLNSINEALIRVDTTKEIITK